MRMAKRKTKLTAEQREKQLENQRRLERIIERRLAEEAKLRVELGVERI
jgi:hypothetical protein